jgi:hypothetical protein
VDGTRDVVSAKIDLWFWSCDRIHWDTEVLAGVLIALLYINFHLKTAWDAAPEALSQKTIPAVPLVLQTKLVNMYESALKEPYSIGLGPVGGWLLPERCRVWCLDVLELFGPYYSEKDWPTSQRLWEGAHRLLSGMFNCNGNSPGFDVNNFLAGLAPVDGSDADDASVDQGGGVSPHSPVGSNSAGAGGLSRERRTAVLDSLLYLLMVEPWLLLSGPSFSDFRRILQRQC